MEIDDILNTLFEGGEDAIRNLSGTGVAYRFFPETGGFSIEFNNEQLKAHKVFFEPNCVPLFGNEHTF